MKRNQFLVFSLIGLLFAGVACPVHSSVITSFSGEFDPLNWTPAYTGDGAGIFTFIGSTKLHMTNAPTLNTSEKDD